MDTLDRLSVWFWLLLGLVAWLAPRVRQRLERRRSSAPPVRDTWQPTPPGVGQWTSFSLDPNRGVEETRLMPGAEQRDPGDENDQVTEGLGIVRPRPRRYRRDTSPVVPHWSFDPSAQHAIEELEQQS